MRSRRSQNQLENQIFVISFIAFTSNKNSTRDLLLFSTLRSPDREIDPLTFIIPPFNSDLENPQVTHIKISNLLVAKTRKNPTTKCKWHNVGSDRVRWLDMRGSAASKPTISVLEMDQQVNHASQQLTPLTYVDYITRLLDVPPYTIDRWVASD